MTLSRLWKVSHASGSILRPDRCEELVIGPLWVRVQTFPGGHGEVWWSTCFDPPYSTRCETGATFEVVQAMAEGVLQEFIREAGRELLPVSPEVDLAIEEYGDACQEWRNHHGPTLGPIEDRLRAAIAADKARAVAAAREGMRRVHSDRVIRSRGRS